MSCKSRIVDEELVDPASAEAYIYLPVNGSGAAVDGAAEGTGSAAVSEPGALWRKAAERRSIKRHTEDEVRNREKLAFEEGLREGENRARRDFEKALVREHEGVRQALEDFSRERETYYHRAEAEVLRLSLSIARKILHREAQVDPLVLAGIVRVALEKISTESSVRLRVHPSHVAMWQPVMGGPVMLQPVPEIVGDASLSESQCILESQVGSTDLSLEAQLKEVEQGFLDLMALRPSKS